MIAYDINVSLGRCNDVCNDRVMIGVMAGTFSRGGAHGRPCLLRLPLYFFALTVCMSLRDGGGGGAINY